MTRDQTYVAKWTAFNNISSGGYSIASKITTALPIGAAGVSLQELAGSTLYVGFTKNNDLNTLLRDGVYAAAKEFEKDTYSLPDTTASATKLFAPGETENSAPIALSAIPTLTDLQFPTTITAFGGKIRITPKNGIAGDFSTSGIANNQDDMLEIQVKAGTVTGTPNEAYAIVNGHKIKFETITLFYKTVQAESLSTDSNNPTALEGAKITIPTGATEAYLTRKYFNGTTENISYTSGTLIQPDDIGYDYRLLFKNTQGTIEKFYFQSTPSLYSKKVSIFLHPNGTQAFSMKTLNPENYKVFDSVEVFLLAVGADTDQSLSITPGLKVEFVSYDRTTGISNWKAVSDTTLQLGIYNYTGKFTNNTNYTTGTEGAHDFKWTFNIQQ